MSSSANHTSIAYHHIYRVFLIKFEMDQYFNNNKQKENIQNYILKCR